jgi:hypothetical protein
MIARRMLLVSVLIGGWVAVSGVSGQEAKAKKGPPKAKKAELETGDAFGRPEGSIVDQTARYYVWYDGEEWHLRTTAKQTRNFNGTIRVTDAKIKSCVPVGLKNDRQKKTTTDAWRLNDERSELKFAFRTSTLSDGLDIVVDGDGQIEFELLIDTQKNPKNVFLGKKGEHPSQNPFRLPVKVERK